MTIEERVNQLETDARVREAEYRALVEKILDHMGQEDERWKQIEKRLERNSELMSQIFDLIRAQDQHLTEKDEKVKAEMKDWAKNEFATKLETQEKINKVDRKASRITWTTGGISIGLSTVLLFIMIFKNAGTI